MSVNIMTRSNVVSLLPQFLAAVPGLLIFLTRATHHGWSSPAIQELRSGNSSITITAAEGATIVSLFGFGGFGGPILMLLTSDLISRRAGMLISALAGLFGWLLIIFATTIEEIYVARTIAGFGGGVCVTVVPLYLSEISSDQFRGGICSFPQFMVIIGPILEYAMTPFLSFKETAMASAVIPFIVLPMLHWMPESPYYKLIKNRDTGAKNSLQLLRQKNVDDEFETMRYNIQMQMENKSGFKELFTKRNNRNALTIICALSTICIGSGFIIVTSYVHIILRQFSDDIPVDTLALVTSTVPCISCILFSTLVDKIGKKSLLFISCTGSFLSTLVIALFLHAKYLDYGTNNYVIVPIICIILYVFMQSLGLASITFIYVGELFTTNVKMYASSIVYCYLFTLMPIFNEVSQKVIDNYGYHYVFYIFSLASLIGLMYILIIPETKGKSLQEIQIKLGRKCQNLELNNM